MPARVNTDIDDMQEKIEGAANNSDKVEITLSSAVDFDDQDLDGQQANPALPQVSGQG